MTTISILFTLGVLFLAAITKSTLGFGDALLAIPLLTLALGLQVATPLVALVGAGVTLLLLARNWQQVDLSAARRLTTAAVVGIPLGVWGLKSLPEAWMTTGLGVFLIAVGIYQLTHPALPTLAGNGWAYLFGLFAGVLAGAYTMGGPPVIVYGAVRGWSPEQFRGTLQSFFLPVSTLTLIAHVSAGLWTTQVWELFLASIPVMLLAFWLGNRLASHITNQLFARLVYSALIVLGSLLLV